MINSSGIKEISTTPTGIRDMKIPEFDTSRHSGRAEFDFSAEIEKMAREAQEKQRRRAAGVSGLALIADDMEMGLIDEEVGGVFNRIDKQVREARALIERDQCQEAVEILEKALAESPHHIDATYWRAYAKEKLGHQPDAILRSILPLNEMHLKPAMADRVERLRTGLRPLFAKWLVETFGRLKETKGMPVALELAREGVGLDPRSVQGYSLWAGGLLAIGNPARARSVALDGIKACRGDETASLEKMLEEARRRLLEEILKPAIGHYKAASYMEARRAVEALDPEYRELPLCQRFSGYLKALEQGGGKLRHELPGPSGNPAEVEELHELLVRDEMAAAQAFMAKLQCEKAEDQMSLAIAYAPHFHFASFLYAMTVFLKSRIAFIAGNQPDLDTVIGWLEQARPYAEYAASDEGIRDGKSMLEMIDQDLKMLGDIRVEVMELEREAKLINPLIKEFIDIMDSANGGVDSVAMFDRIYERLKSLLHSVRRTRPQIKSERGKKEFDNFAEAVERNWAELEKAKSDLAPDPVVTSLVSRFNEKMESVVRGGAISDISQVVELFTFMTSLQSDIDAALRNVSSPKSRKALADLRGATETILKQLVPR